MLIDSHCHLDFPELEADLDGVLIRAKTAGVGLMLTISTKVRNFTALRAIAEAHDNVFCSIGTHPHHAAEEPDIAVEELVELSRHPKVVAIGEAGRPEQLLRGGDTRAVPRHAVWTGSTSKAIPHE